MNNLAVRSVDLDTICYDLVRSPDMCLCTNITVKNRNIGYSPLGFSTLSCGEILLLLELISILLDIRFLIHVWFYIFWNALLTGPNSILFVKFKACIKCTTFELINIFVLFLAAKWLTTSNPFSWYLYTCFG